MDVKWFIAISTIIICNIRHIQSAKVEKIDKIFIFENQQKMTKSGSLVTTVKEKNQKLVKTIYFHELDYSE